MPRQARYCSGGNVSEEHKLVWKDQERPGREKPARRPRCAGKGRQRLARRRRGQEPGESGQLRHGPLSRQWAIMSFYFLAIVQSAAANAHGQAFVWTCDFRPPEHTPRSGRARPCRTTAGHRLAPEVPGNSHTTRVWRTLSQTNQVHFIPPE